MIRILLKKQWKKTLILVVFFCGILLVRNIINSEFKERYYADQKEYLNQYDLSNREDFFENLEEDTQTAKEIVRAIENYESYEGEMPEVTMDNYLEMITGHVGYADYDMAVWRENMLNMPGQYSDTVQNDNYVLRYLSQRLANQNNFEENLENNIEIMKRGIRRNAGQVEIYEAVLCELQKVNTEFAVEDTVIIDKILDYIESDYFIIILIVLSAFSIFSSVLQNKISNPILVSRVGMRKFALSQIAVTMGITLFGLIIYYIGVILALSKGNLGEIPWNLPIQAINGYEKIFFAFSVGQYFLISVALKVIYCMLIMSIVLLISMLCRNTIISAVISFAGCWGVVILYNSWALEQKLSYGSLVIGSSRFLWTDLPYVYVGERIIPYVVFYISIIVFASLIMLFATVVVSKVTAKKWVSR